jgi:hypothetical protein
VLVLLPQQDDDDDDDDDFSAAEVSSTFAVESEINYSLIDYNYLPMDVVCFGHMDGVWSHACTSNIPPNNNIQVPTHLT